MLSSKVETRTDLYQTRTNVGDDDDAGDDDDDDVGDDDGNDDNMDDHDDNINCMMKFT